MGIPHSPSECVNLSFFLNICILAIKKHVMFLCFITFCRLIVSAIGSPAFRSKACLRAGENKFVKYCQSTWNVWISDLNCWKEVSLPRSSSCALLLHTLLTTLERKPDLTHWSIVEQNSEAMIERFVEDYESLDELFHHRENEDEIHRLCLNRTPAKYVILQRPEHCLSTEMLTFPPGFTLEDGAPEQVKRSLMQEILTTTAPEMCGWLHMREQGKKSWKKFYCVLRNSGFYCSHKGTSKEANHLTCIAEVHAARAWFPINSKKQQSHAPTPFSFCLKFRAHQHEELRWFCAENNHLKTAWINALRLTLDGNKFYESYFSAKNYDPSNLIRSPSDRMINKNSKCDSNFVAMDFSGSRGRVIQDPVEVAMVGMPQAPSSRRRLPNRPSNSTLQVPGMEQGVLGSSAPTRSASFSKAIHMTQPWFYGKISREAASEEIQRHGSLDGTFLLRESHTIPGSVVITICYSQKSRHIPITRIERSGRLYYTCDNGETRFQDLIQLVDFHRLNKGPLPCPLLHECNPK